MQLKLVLLNCPGRIFLINVYDAATVLDLKQSLTSKITISAQSIKIKFLEKRLQDGEALLNIAQRIQALAAPPNNDGKTDLMVFQQDKLVGRLKFVDDVAMPKNVCSDSTVASTSTTSVPESTGRCMDAECYADGSNSSSIQSSSGNQADATSNPDDDPVVNTGCREGCCPLDRSRPMYMQVMPEHRQYAAVIEGGTCKSLNVDRVLHFLTEHIRAADESKALVFSICAPVVLVENAIMIFAGDSDTRDWILRVTKPICPPYQCQTFIKYFDLVRWCITVPLPGKWSLCRVFRILEQQNCPLDTSTWCVMSQFILDPCMDEFAKKAVDEAYTNVEYVIYIDRESADRITKSCNKIDYLVWKLPFRPCGTVC